MLLNLKVFLFLLLERGPGPETAVEELPGVGPPETMVIVGQSEKNGNDKMHEYFINWKNNEEILSHPVFKINAANDCFESRVS